MLKVCSTESQFTLTAIGVQFIFRNTVGIVLAGIAFTRKLICKKKKNKQNKSRQRLLEIVLHLECILMGFIHSRELLTILSMTGRKIRVLQVLPVVLYKALGNFPEALYGKTRSTCSAQCFRPVMCSRDTVRQN